MQGKRSKWTTFAVLLALLGGGSLLIVLLGGGDAEGRPIEVERAVAATGIQELLITVSDEANVPATTDGEELVDLICTDARGEMVVRGQHQWPLISDGEPPEPHIHQAASLQELDEIARCRIEGTDPLLQGRVGLAR